LDESGLNRIRQRLQQFQIKKAQIDPRCGYWKWASVIIFVMIVGAAGISQKGRDILVQTLASIPEKLKEEEFSLKVHLILAKEVINVL
jgi:hypothetical protein